ncbi:deoxyribose-phosphate aldolase [Leucobacter chinensis]|uniref:deoxyribose-phosphate aldolase n=1 Tax=Leucobacter chinensis TaxID=2851010 RepID=UPI001C233A9A|nr:deoxyribose-phosphate aldolase [Leucobacter chinensis]
MTNAEATPKQPLDAERFAEIADHTLLAGGTTMPELDRFLAEARELGVKRVCVSPSLLPVDKHGLEIVTVIGFPSGAHHAEIKAAETTRAVRDGADEIDMVVNLGLVHVRDYAAVEAEVRMVREACGGKVLKVILETAELADDEIVGASLAAARGGADFVKTSTGFSKAGGASVHAVSLMSGAVGDTVGVKASGGVRTASEVEALWQAGATRFGVSGTASIIAELRGESPAESSGGSY